MGEGAAPFTTLTILPCTHLHSGRSRKNSGFPRRAPFKPPPPTAAFRRNPFLNPCFFLFFWGPFIQPCDLRLLVHRQPLTRNNDDATPSPTARAARLYSLRWTIPPFIDTTFEDPLLSLPGKTTGLCVLCLFPFCQFSNHSLRDGRPTFSFLPFPTGTGAIHDLGPLCPPRSSFRHVCSPSSPRQFSSSLPLFVPFTTRSWFPCVCGPTTHSLDSFLRTAFSNFLVSGRGYSFLHPSFSCPL